MSAMFPRVRHDDTGKLSAHFSNIEFQCKCGVCEAQWFDPALFELLEKLRRGLGDAPITITSGYRCEKHNAAVGGSKNSQHLYGKAADIKVKGVNPREVAQIARTLGFGGIGVYSSWVHVDTRPMSSAGATTWGDW